MELVASLPVDCLVAADPLARGPAPLLRPPEADGATPAPVLPFELFLQLLNAPLPGGEALPVDGNGLPAPPSKWPAAVGTGEILDAAAAAAGESEPTEPLNDVGLERFGLTPALRAVLPAPAPAVTMPDAAVAGVVAGNAAPPGLELGVGLDGPDSPSTVPLPEPLRSETPAATRQSALAAMVAEVEPAAPNETRSRGRPAATSAPPSAASAEPEGATAQTQTPAASAVAATPLAEISASGMRVRRDTAAPPLPLVASAADAAGSSGTAAPTAWHLPAGSTTTTASGAAATAPAAHGAAVDTRSPNWHDAFAGRVQWLVDHQIGEARIKLNPPELGAVDVKISLVDDKTYVQLTAGSAATRDELTQSLPRLRELLTASGLELGGAAVHSGHGGHGYDGRDTGGAVPVEALEALGEGSHFVDRPRRAPGRIDTFA